MNLSLLPGPRCMRRRHEALASVEDLLGGSADSFRSYGAEAPDHYWFDTGSGDSYELIICGDEALLTVFDHESPRSPWAREDGLREWPGMFDGLPDRLRKRLPEPEDDEPLSVSACFWYVDGAWHEGRPEPVDDDDGYGDDPGGALGVLAPLLDPESEAREMVTYVHEQPERLDEALAVLRRLDALE
jgi:hypothetical protein